MTSYKQEIIYCNEETEANCEDVRCSNTGIKTEQSSEIIIEKEPHDVTEKEEMKMIFDHISFPPVQVKTEQSSVIIGNGSHYVTENEEMKTTFEHSSFPPVQVKIEPFQPDMSSNEVDEFNEDLFRTMIRANISLSTLDNKHFRDFLKKYTKKDIPSESTLRKNYTSAVYNSTLDEIKADIGDSPFWLSVEETKENCGTILNIIVGKLSPDKIGTPHLILSKILEDINPNTVATQIQDSLQVLLPQKNLLVLLTHSAPHMIEAGQALKEVFYPKMLFVTCCMHTLNRLVDDIQSNFPCVNDLISSIEVVFSAAPSQIAEFKESFPNTPLPPQSVVSSSKSWLDAVLYYADHVDKIKQVIYGLNKDEVVGVLEAKVILTNPTLLSCLTFVKVHFAELPGKIKKLEERDIPLLTSVQIMAEVQSIVEKIQGSIGMLIRQNYKDQMKENPNWMQVLAVADEMIGNYRVPFQSRKIPLPSFLSPTDIEALNYCPVTVCEVSRCFPQFKTIFMENKHMCSTQNLEQYLVIHCHNNT